MKKLFKIVSVLIPILVITGCSSASSNAQSSTGTDPQGKISERTERKFDELCIDATDEVVKVNEKNKFSLKTIKKFSDKKIEVFDKKYKYLNNECNVYYSSSQSKILVNGTATLKIDVTNRAKADRKSLADLFASRHYVGNLDYYMIATGIPHQGAINFSVIYEKQGDDYVFEKVVDGEEDFAPVRDLLKQEKYISEKYEENILNEVNK